MTGPSAIGSENGNPSSMTSAPASVIAASNSTVRSASGCPAVMYGMSARRPAAFSAANRFAIASDEIVADADAIAVGIVGLDDGASKHAVWRLIREIHKDAGMNDVAKRVRNDTNDRP